MNGACVSPTISGKQPTGQQSGGGGVGGGNFRRPQESSSPQSSLLVRRTRSQGGRCASNTSRLQKCASLAIPHYEIQEHPSSPVFSSPPSTPPFSSNYGSTSVWVGGGTEKWERDSGGSGFVGCSSSSSSKTQKLDSSFARSRSSSMSSLDNISSEAIQCLAFIDSYTRKGDSSTWPTLWVGTSLGSVIVITINFPPVPELRQTQPLIVMPSGTIFRLKGGILAMSFLDCNGALIPYSYESWKSNVKNEGRDKTRTPTRNSATINKMSPTQGNQETQIGDCRQFAVLASEKHARVVALPSLTCAYRQQLTDNYFVVKAEIVSMKDSVCLVAYIANGRLVAYSLPSLKPLLDIDFLPLTSLRIVRTFCFSNHGQGLYLCSPSEIQKFTIDSDFGNNLLEMMGTLFTIKEIPEPPKEGFFKGLFGGGVRSLDREELFGEEKSGKASKTIAKHIPGPAANIDMLNVRANTVAGDIARTRNMLVERGEKLGQLEDKSARMMNQAEDFSSAAHQLMLRYRDKKWYQL